MDYFNIIELNGKRLAVYKTGEIVFWDTKKGSRLEIGWNIHNPDVGRYNRYGIYNNKKKSKYLHHRIIAYAFLGLDINDSTQIIDHIDGNTFNNCVENLRIINSQKNSFNRKNIKGYTFDGYGYPAFLKLNGKRISLGYYKTAEEAHQAYLDGKEKYHKI